MTVPGHLGDVLLQCRELPGLGIAASEEEEIGDLLAVGPVAGEPFLEHRSKPANSRYFSNSTFFMPAKPRRERS